MTDDIGHRLLRLDPKHLHYILNSNVSVNGDAEPCSWKSAFIVNYANKFKLTQAFDYLFAHKEFETALEVKFSVKTNLHDECCPSIRALTRS